MLTLKDPPSNFQLPPHNEAALEMLREAKDYQSTLALAASGAALGTGGIVHPLGWLLFGLAYKPLVATQKLARLEKLTARLLDEFRNEGIQVFPVLKIDDKNPIDLFVRFERKIHLFISIRSIGDKEIVYNEAREVLQIKRKDKHGLKVWNPCPLLELADYEKWLSKNRDLFGMSSREATKTPSAKVLVLWPPTKAAEDHNSHLYSEVGSMKILALRRKGTVFVIQQEEVTEFVKATLAKYE
ncbi:hypothetical protein VB735_31160 [Halotia wernerae UHCC 0503]|nr:hypothetical protein [Halotia wernerae UHCC 0503]